MRENIIDGLDEEEYQATKKLFLTLFRIEELGDLTVKHLVELLDPSYGPLPAAVCRGLKANLSDQDWGGNATYWRWMERWLRTMAFQTTSSVTESPVFGVSYALLLGEDMEHPRWNMLLKNFESRYAI